jgi:hypothetical protein
VTKKKERRKEEKKNKKILKIFTARSQLGPPLKPHTRHYCHCGEHDEHFLEGCSEALLLLLLLRLLLLLLLLLRL